MVIFGALGDLSRRKLLPAIYQLMKEHLVDPEFAVLGVGRDDARTDDTLPRGDAQGARRVGRSARRRRRRCGTSCASGCYFVSADLTNADDYALVGKRLAEIEKRPRRRRSATGCSTSRCRRACSSRSCGISRRAGWRRASRTADERPWVRVVIEKPFGRSLESAQQLNDLVLGLFAEHQTYRIDHYLGKETVQNVLVLRFANSIFEPIWNRQWIHHVQITAAENVGRRGARQVLRGSGRRARHVPEPPAAAAEPHGDGAAAADGGERGARREGESAQVDSLAHAGDDPAERGARAVHRRARSAASRCAATPRSPTSRPTRRCRRSPRVRLFVDNWRWNGVPFYLRSGKRLKKRVSEIAVQFRSPPHLMFGETSEHDAARTRSSCACSRTKASRSTSR